jgi:hypothetical protein
MDEKLTTFKPVIILPEALRSKTAASKDAVNTVHL